MKEPLVLVREGRLDEAEVICRARVAAGSADADTCYALGRIAMKRGARDSRDRWHFEGANTIVE